MVTKQPPLEILLHKVSQYVELQEEDRRALLGLPVRVRRVENGSFLACEGTPPPCGIILEGFAFRKKLTGEGRREIVAICIPGDANGLQQVFQRLSDHSIRMATRGRVADIDRDAFQELVLSHSCIARAVIEMAVVEASILREWIVNLGRRDSRARIAHLLCEMVLRLKSIGEGDGGRFDFPLTQEQLADATGLTPVHTNRTLQSLRKDGLIELSAKSLTVLDWNKLREVGDFDELYLHHTV